VITNLADRKGWSVPLLTDKAKRSVMDALRRFRPEPAQFEIGISVDPPLAES
jgi:hypothetical protein